MRRCGINPSSIHQSINSSGLLTFDHQPLLPSYGHSAARTSRSPIYSSTFHHPHPRHFATLNVTPPPTEVTVSSYLSGRIPRIRIELNHLPSSALRCAAKHLVSTFTSRIQSQSCASNPTHPVPEGLRKSLTVVQLVLSASEGHDIRLKIQRKKQILPHVLQPSQPSTQDSQFHPLQGVTVSYTPNYRISE